MSLNRPTPSRVRRRTQCYHCGRKWRNKQAVRAHLAFCTVYLAKKAGEDPAELQAAAEANLTREAHRVLADARVIAAEVARQMLAEYFGGTPAGAELAAGDVAEPRTWDAPARPLSRFACVECGAAGNGDTCACGSKCWRDLTDDIAFCNLPRR